MFPWLSGREGIHLLVIEQEGVSAILPVGGVGFADGADHFLLVPSSDGAYDGPREGGQRLVVPSFWEVYVGGREGDIPLCQKSFLRENMIRRSGSASVGARSRLEEKSD